MIEYRTVDKSSWGPGPWQDEPDKRQWKDQATGLPCLIVRGPVGALCGYVGVPPGHPLHGQGYDEAGLDCHGGLTYAAGCSSAKNPETGVCHIPDPGEPDHVWWFGFDCAHFSDLTPGLDSKYRFNQSGQSYRDIGYVTAECTSLAKQLAAAATVI